MSKADATDWLRKNRLTGPPVVNRSEGLDFIALGGRRGWAPVPYGLRFLQAA